jgi:hypothetical protein
MDGTAIVVRLSNGREIEAEYWEGPPGKEREWGGWAWNGTRSFVEETTSEDSEAEWLGWKLLTGD